MTGVGLKISAQSKALSGLSSDYSFISSGDDYKCRVSSNAEVLKESFVYIPLLLRYRFKALFDFIVSKKVELVYIRYTHFASPSFLRFLYELKRINIIIILEFPTFPYDSEYKLLGLSSKVKLKFDQLFRVRLKDFVDYAITFTETESDILGIKTICISNAVDRLAIEKRREILIGLASGEVYASKEIVFTAVSSMHSWHGIDRFINSVDSYVRQENNIVDIKFNIVGDGPEFDRLKKLVIDKELSRYVYFYGQLNGTDLQSILVNTHIGVDSLARFRSGNLSNNSLKSKEYLSYGLPIIKSHIDNSIDNNEFIFNVANDESIINIDEIIVKYKESAGVNDRLAINQFCYSHFTWDVQFANVIKRVNSDN